MYGILFIFVILVAILFVWPNSGFGCGVENYRDPVFYEPNQMNYDLCPRVVGSIYGESNHLLGFSNQDKAY